MMSWSIQCPKSVGDTSMDPESEHLNPGWNSNDVTRWHKVARSWWKSDSRVGALVKVIPREPSADAISIFGIQIRTFTSSLHLAYGWPAQAESHSCSGCLSQSGALLHRLRPHGELIQLWYNRMGQLDNWKCSKENPWKSHSGRLLGPFPTCNPPAWCQSCCSSFAEGFHRTVQILTIGSSNPSDPMLIRLRKSDATGSKRHFQRWSTARHRTHLLNIEIARPGNIQFLLKHMVFKHPSLKHHWNHPSNPSQKISGFQDLRSFGDDLKNSRASGCSQAFRNERHVNIDFNRPIIVTWRFLVQNWCCCFFWVYLFVSSKIHQPGSTEVPLLEDCLPCFLGNLTF